MISYLRLFEGTHERTYRRVVWIAVVAIFLGHLGCTLSLVFACNPVSKSWNPLLDGTCLPNGPSFTGYAIVTIISDVAVSIIPLPVLVKLNIPLSKKIGLGVIFLLGLFTTICSIMRYLQIDRIQFGDGNSTMLVLWGTVEFNVGVSSLSSRLASLLLPRKTNWRLPQNMVSSLPFLAPVFLRKAKAYRSKRSVSDGTAPRLGRSGDHYKLSSINRDRSAFVSATGETGSEENILKDHVIIKSVTVHIDEEQASEPSRGPQGF